MGWDPSVSNETRVNMLVNERRQVADERGTSHLILDSTKYTGQETMELSITQHYWIYTAFWLNYQFAFHVLGTLSFVFFAVNAKST